MGNWILRKMNGKVESEGEKSILGIRCEFLGFDARELNAAWRRQLLDVFVFVEAFLSDVSIDELQHSLLVVLVSVEAFRSVVLINELQHPLLFVLVSVELFPSNVSF